MGDVQRPLYPGLVQAVCLLIAGIILLIAGVFVMTVYLPGSERNPLALGLLNLFVLGSLIGFGWERIGGDFYEVFRLKPIRPMLMGPMAALIVGLSILTSEFDNLFQFLVGSPPSNFDLSWLYLDPGINPAALFFLLVLVAPITEELLFRGLILRGFLKRYSKGKAVLLSALLFALFHVNPWQMIGAFVIGSILGWWFVRTGSLLPCIIGHAAYNLVPLLALQVLPPIPGFTDLAAGPQFHPLAVDMIGVALAGLGGLRLFRALEGRRNSQTSSSIPDGA